MDRGLTIHLVELFIAHPSSVVKLVDGGTDSHNISGWSHGWLAGAEL
jgi:hypothetical protein